MIYHFMGIGVNCVEFFEENRHDEFNVNKPVFDLR